MWLVYTLTPTGDKLYCAGPDNSLYTLKQRQAHRYVTRPMVFEYERIVRLK